MKDRETNAVQITFVAVAAVLISLWILRRNREAPLVNPETKSDAETKSNVETKRKAKVTYRVRGVPTGWDHSRLQSFLAQHAGSGHPVIHSFSEEINGRSRTATVTFSNGGIVPRALRLPPPQAQDAPLADLGPSTRPQGLFLDEDFLGITTLYTPAKGHHKVE